MFCTMHLSGIAGTVGLQTQGMQLEVMLENISGAEREGGGEKICQDERSVSDPLIRK